MDKRLNNVYDFGSKFAQTYKSSCLSCGKEMEVSTQEDACPEYRTDINVKCECGDSVEFSLPVN